MKDKNCRHQFTEAGGNCVICGESSITTTAMKDKNWEKKFDNKFVTDSFMGQIMGKPRYIGNETQEVKNIKAFIRKLLEEERIKVIDFMSLDAEVAKKHQKQELKKRVEGIRRKEIDRNRTTDERRYPHGYNQAVSDIIRLLEEDD